VALAVDADGKWGAVVCSRTVHLLSLKGPVPTYHGRVPAPKHVSPITAAAFNSRGDSMVVSTAGNHIALFQVNPRSYLIFGVWFAFRCLASGVSSH
jgi:hypothetical protein